MAEVGPVGQRRVRGQLRVLRRVHPAARGLDVDVRARLVGRADHDRVVVDRDPLAELVAGVAVGGAQARGRRRVCPPGRRLDEHVGGALVALAADVIVRRPHDDRVPCDGDRLAHAVVDRPVGGGQVRALEERVDPQRIGRAAVVDADRQPAFTRRLEPGAQLAAAGVARPQPAVGEARAGEHRAAAAVVEARSRVAAEP